MTRKSPETDQFATKQAQNGTRKYLAEKKVRDLETYMGDAYKTTRQREEQQFPEIQMSLKVLGLKGEIKDAPSGRTILEIADSDLISKHLKSFSPTASTLERSKHTFAVRSVTKGHRKIVNAVSCEIEDYVKLCKEFRVPLPARVAEHLGITTEQPSPSLR